MDTQTKTWVSNQLRDAVHELMDKGVFDELLIEAKPAWALPETIVIGQARIKGNSANFFWILCGDAPTMCIEGSLAATPRLALRHFAYTWQRNLGIDGSENTELVKKAESMFQLTDIDELWADSDV